MTVLKISGILNRQRNGILISGLFIILVGWFDSGVAENCSGRTYEKLEAARVDFRAVKNQLEPGAPPMRVVSPDGTKVAALEKVKILMESQVFRLVVTGSDGGERQVHDQVVNYYGLTWSPDSTKLAYSEGCLVHIVDQEVMFRTTIYTGPGGPYPGACFDLKWAKNGGELSFVQIENAQQPDLSSPIRVIVTLAKRNHCQGSLEGR